MRPASTQRANTRWLLAIVFGWLLFVPGAFACLASSDVTPQAVSGCCATCDCCVEQAPETPAVPIIPATSSRVSVDHISGLLLPALAVLLLDSAPTTITASAPLLPHFSLSTPLFLRHRAILI